MQCNSILKIPKFKNYGIITSESLNILNNNLFDYIESKYINSSDGIIAGLDISINNNSVLVSKGIVKIDSNIVFITNDVNIDLPEKEGRYVLVLEYLKTENEFYFENIIDFRFIEDKNCDDQFIVFKIILRDGANISSMNTNFDEYRKEFNTIDITCQKYSVNNSKYSTINPELMKKWAKKFSRKSSLDSIDINFIFFALNSVVSRELIVAYLNIKLKNENLETEISNEDIIKKLSVVLNSVSDVEDKENYSENETFYVL